MTLHPLTIALAHCRDSKIANPCGPTVLPMHRVLAHDAALAMHNGRAVLARLPLPTSPREQSHALPIGVIEIAR